MWFWWFFFFPPTSLCGEGFRTTTYHLHSSHASQVIHRNATPEQVLHLPYFGRLEHSVTAWHQFDEAETLYLLPPPCASLPPFMRHLSYDALISLILLCTAYVMKCSSSFRAVSSLLLFFFFFFGTDCILSATVLSVGLLQNLDIDREAVVGPCTFLRISLACFWKMLRS
jgi:hypothetical protein